MPPINQSKGEVARKNTGDAESPTGPNLPAEFEKFIQDNKTLLLNDPLREILLYPQDDVSCAVLPRRWRTVTTTVPNVRTAAACPLLTRQALLSYASSWNLVHYKYSHYASSYLHLPRSIENKLPEEVYNFDAELEDCNDGPPPKTEARTKEGFLLKGPEIGSERIFSNLASKTFKKRYCSMVKEADGTYILEVYKDDKKTDSKLTVVMDYCSEVVKNPKRGRYCLELRMAGGTKGYSFSAENEEEFADWFTVFSGALKKDGPGTAQSDENLDKEPPPPTYGTLKGLELSMNPLLMRYSRESDLSIAAARAEARSNVFSLPFRSVPSPEPPLEPFKEHFGQRILLKCESLKFRLQAPIDGDKELLCQVEPYFTHLALYDARLGRKITEDFHFDLNHEAVSDLVKDNECTKSLVENFSCDVKLDVKQIPDDWFRAKRQVIMSINNPHPDIFIVVRIDKILQGNISQVSEPYLKATKDPRLGLKIHKMIRAYANRVGAYRMPFAWSAKPLFRLYSNELDTSSDFPALYRQEPGKMSDEDIVKILCDYRKPEKVAKLTVIPGWLSIAIQHSLESVPNCMTSSYAALKPFPLPPSSPLTLELSSPGAEPEQPYAAFVHHLYVRPLLLNFDSQKIFARARNISCSIELRDSDTGDNKGLQVVYGRVGMSNRHRCALLHHNSSPAWCDEAKLRLPVTLTDRHHLLFTFHHISCDLTKKNDNVETCIGYAWIPLLKNGKVVDEFVNLPIATHLPSGYLSIQPLGLGKGNSGPEVVWVEGEKALFRCQLVLDSSVLTRDPHLHNLFKQAERMLQAESPTGSPIAPPWGEICNALKAAHAIKLSSLVAFLPTIFNQLFELMTLDKSYSSDMGYQIVKLIVHYVHMIHDYGRKDLLDSYVKYVFNCIGFKVHNVLTAPLYKFVDPAQQDFLLGHKFMQYSGFFFDIVVKSMAQYLINTGRIKMARSERFPSDLSQNIEKLMSTVEPSYILQQPMQTHIFNKNLAIFLKSCLSFMDRGFVFQQIQKYMSKFKMCDPKALFDFKFTFLQTICSHEHFVSFNLPLQVNKASKLYNDEYTKMKFTEEYMRRHFLAATLMKQVEASLREAPQKRRTALGVLRALLTKHEHDDRYATRQCRARVAQLYAPWLNIVLDNAHRLIAKDTGLAAITENGHDKVDGDATPANPVNPIISGHKEVVSANCTPKRNRLTLHFDQNTPIRNSIHFRDPIPVLNSTLYGKESQNSVSRTSIESDLSTMSGGDSLPRTVTKVDLNEIGDQVNRFGVMAAEEARDVLLCFLFVLKYTDEERLVGWWKSSTDTQIQSFFNVLEICAEHFQYLGRKRILSEMRTTTPDSACRIKPMKARTLPARMSPPDFSKEPPLLVEKNNTVNRENLVSNNVASELDQIAEHTVLAAGCLATEVGLTIIDRVCLFTKHMGAAGGIAAKPYVKLLQLPQSDTLYRHLFAALRAYINQFSETLFEGGSSLCGGVVSAVVRLCEARAAWLRREAAAALYLLMRANFQHADSRALTRVHLQVIISVSKLLDDTAAINYNRFQESLSVINGFASGDKAMKGTGLSSEVAELMRRVRTVVGARCRLADAGGGVHLAELQHALAASCRATPRLRHAALATLADHHLRQGDSDQAMCCHLHIAALIAEYLRLSGMQDWGAGAFADISLNIPRDETGLKIDEGMTEAQYNENALLEQLGTCAEYAERAERYELLGPLYRLVIPILERRKDYRALLDCYQHLTKAYSKVIEVNQSGKRLLGRFYRVAFFGAHFGEEDAGLEFVYKEPKLTSLSEISERLQTYYETKFGAGNVKIIMDSAPVNTSELDSRLAYVQVTYVRAAPEGSTVGCSGGEGVWERAHNVKRFVYETPFTREGGARGPVHHQHLRQTYLTIPWESNIPKDHNFKLNKYCNLVDRIVKNGFKTDLFAVEVGARGLPAKSLYSLFKNLGLPRSALSSYMERASKASLEAFYRIWIAENWFPYVKKRSLVVDTQTVEKAPIEVALGEMEAQVQELQEIVNARVPDIKRLQLRLQGSICAQVNAGPLAYANAFLDPALSPLYPDHTVHQLKMVFKEFLTVCHSALLLNAKLISSDQTSYHEALESNYYKLSHALSQLLGERLQQILVNGSLSTTVTGVELESSNA